LLILTLLTLAAGVAIGDEVIRIEPQEAQKAVVEKVDPTYPEMAKTMKLTGDVQLNVVIAETGSVESVKVLSGNPLLTGSARKAMKQWRFTPIERDGKPIKAAVVYAFSFK
jgi:TonB family protein